MNKLNDIIKLTGNKDIDNLLLILIAIRLKESSAEAGTYNFLISETEAFSCLNKVFMIEKGSKDIFTNDFSWHKSLDVTPKFLGKDKNEMVIINLYGDLTVFKLDTTSSIKIAVYVIVALLLENESFIAGLVNDYKRIDGYRLKAKSTRTSEGVFQVECLMCKSFDDFRPLYAYRDVIYETSRYYITNKGDAVYK